MYMFMMIPFLDRCNVDNIDSRHHCMYAHYRWYLGPGRGRMNENQRLGRNGIP